MKVDVAETFISIQGESAYAGLGCFFVRMAGCNLRCNYCDTPNALEPSGNLVEINTLVKDAQKSRMPLIEITGGEPLTAPNFTSLAESMLRIPETTLLVETNGSLDISQIPEEAVAVIDVKCPDSGAGGSFDLQNLQRLRPRDELKFVISSHEDFRWAADFVRRHNLTSRLNPPHFSPVSNRIKPSKLADWILHDCLPVRLQLQLHRLLGLQ